MSMKKAIAEVEGTMAELQARIDAVAASTAPIRAELDELLAEQQAVQVRIDATVADLNAERGDPQAWIDLKKQYATLAATRMQMRAALPLT